MQTISRIKSLTGIIITIILTCTTVIFSSNTCRANNSYIDISCSFQNFCFVIPIIPAKAAAFWQVANYRETYNLFACSGILFNHESPLRPDRFVTQKIVNAACRIASGSSETLNLGNIEVRRDWGWAPEYVEAMWLMLQQNQPEDYIVATGKTFSLKEFVIEVFSCLDLNWEDHVQLNPALLRPTDIMASVASPAKAKDQLGWRAGNTMPDVARLMVEHRRKQAPA